MNRIVKVLMKRDGLSAEDAKRIVQDVREEICAAAEAGRYWEAEDIMMNELGLEMDYIMDIL